MGHHYDVLCVVWSVHGSQWYYTSVESRHWYMRWHHSNHMLQYLIVHRDLIWTAHFENSSLIDIEWLGILRETCNLVITLMKLWKSLSQQVKFNTFLKRSGLVTRQRSRNVPSELLKHVAVDIRLWISKLSQVSHKALPLRKSQLWSPKMTTLGVSLIAISHMREKVSTKLDINIFGGL